jgi:hypothetical protein
MRVLLAHACSATACMQRNYMRAAPAHACRYDHDRRELLSDLDEDEEAVVFSDEEEAEGGVGPGGADGDADDDDQVYDFGEFYDPFNKRMVRRSAAPVCVARSAACAHGMPTAAMHLRAWAPLLLQPEYGTHCRLQSSVHVPLPNVYHPPTEGERAPGSVLCWLRFYCGVLGCVVYVSAWLLLPDSSPACLWCATHIICQRFEHMPEGCAPCSG